MTWTRRLFNGKCQVVLQAAREPGDLILTWFADAVAEKNLRIPVCQRK